ncbi:DUF4181 domain-containing protein [Piscibacillus halophilus]|uniref:DUF4181 domain-containing protein n=1 Tax=Piscibacillus halophilus TaxID=571933 RepID=UPI00240906E4|nr:DUF4181 domain-containing protein [Piscibacillus halophilus]
MHFIDILLIFAALFIAAFIVELILTKIFNIEVRTQRYINNTHKKRYRQFLITYLVILFILFGLYILGLIIVFIPITLIVLYPVCSSIVDMVMEWKHARESRRFIISISNIAVYVSFIVLLFTTDFFGYYS